MNDLSPPLPKRGPECPAPAVLEALSAGEPQEHGVAEHARGCADCSRYVAALEEQASAFRKSRPPEIFLRQLDRRAAQPKPRPAFLRWLALAAPLAAVLLLVPRLIGGGDDVTLKGGGLKVVYLRAGGTPQQVEQDARLKEGDALRFWFESPKDGHLLILDLDGTGKASVFHPFEGQRSAPLPARSKEPLEGSVVLDAAPGPEWLVAVFSPKPIDAAPLLKQLEGSFGREMPAVNCDGCEVDTLRIQKSK